MTRAELSWTHAPDLLSDLTQLGLSTRICNLDYWLQHVVHGSFNELERGARSQHSVPQHMLEPGPLRRAITHEFAFRSLTEILATRALSMLSALAPNTEKLEFVLTVTLDEARHARLFRGHLSELGIADCDDDAELVRLARGSDAHLDAIEKFAFEVIREQGDFIGGVLINTVLVEGLLAPAAALSERKWAKLNPVAADVQHGTGIDEARHLAVGCEILRDHLRAHPSDKARLRTILQRGFALWRELPADPISVEREHEFQAGMTAQRALVQQVELVSGVKLIDTTPETRIALAARTTDHLQLSRLQYIGLT
jgi:hypothetical protein